MGLNLSPLISELSLVDKQGDFRKFPIQEPFAWSQRAIVAEVERQYNAGLPVRIIVLKPRQLGTSTLTEAMMFLWCFIHSNMNALIIAHDARTSHALFQKSQMFWDNAPWRQAYKAARSTLHQQAWGNGSAMQVATAGNLGSGVGQTFQAMHTSEASKYPDAPRLMAGLRQTMPRRHKTIEIVESTADGVGNWYHNEWVQAEQGESRYVPLFFPFFKHPEYREHTGISTDLELDDTERGLRKLGASYEAIEWRRTTIDDQLGGDEDLFRQEYPATSHEAFIASGTNVFSIDKLELVYAPPGKEDHRTGKMVKGVRGRLVWNGDKWQHPQFVPDKRGPLTVFKKPVDKEFERQERYFIGADPTKTSMGDPCCAQVINRGTMEQVAVFHDRILPTDFGRELMALGYWYHGAQLCPEVMGGGQQTIATIQNANYPWVWQHRWADKAPGVLSQTFGFAQNFDRKRWAMDRLRYQINHGAITIHDELTYLEMVNYVHLTEFEMGPASRKLHDDAVMALALAIFGSSTEPPFVEYPSNRRLAAVPDIYRQDAAG